MIRCPGCQTTHPVNTIYCTDCGLYLGKGIPTGRLEERQSHSPVPPQPAGSPELTLEVADAGSNIRLTFDRELLVGRPDPTAGVTPDVDLTPFGGLDKGVSRRHARLSRFEDEFVVEDLGSANGTFCNGQQLAPYRGRSLRDGDELRFGRLAVHVRLSSPQT